MQRYAHCACGNLTRCMAPSRHAGAHEFALDPLDREAWNASHKRWSVGRSGHHRHQIPKVVHQTWKGCDNVPAKQHTWRENCMAVNPSWSFKLWTDQDNRRLVETSVEEHR